MNPPKCAVFFLVEDFQKVTNIQRMSSSDDVLFDKQTNNRTCDCGHKRGKKNWCKFISEKKKIEEDESDNDEEPHGLIVLFPFAHCTFWFVSFFFIVADTFDSERSSIIDSPKRS